MKSDELDKGCPEIRSKCCGMPVRQWAKVKGAISEYVLYECIVCGKSTEPEEREAGNE